MDEDKRRAIALWKLTILGPLISARFEHGERRAYFEQAATRTYEHPDGRRVSLAARTLESWYYTWRHGGWEALRPRPRSDVGCSRAISAEVATLILSVKRERPRRSIRRLIRLLERAGKVRRGELSRSSVHRLLQAHGLSARPLRGPTAERRSFLPEHGGDLWMGDVLHGPLVIAPDGRLRKSYLISQLDAATRFVPHSYFALAEGAVEHEYGFKQALLKHGRPATYYVDRGSAYMSDSLRLICAELDLHLVHTLPKDCEAKGAIERWHRTWREEVGDELPDEPLALAALNARHWAWLGAEYHRRQHDTTGREPLAHWLAEVAHLRPLPAHKDLEQVFLHRQSRRVRKDACVRLGGRLLEVRPELCGQTVELRFDPSAPFTPPPRVFVNEQFVCDTVLLDRIKNSRRTRRRQLGAPDPAVPSSGLDPLTLIEREHYTRTQLATQPNDDDEKED